MYDLMTQQRAPGFPTLHGTTVRVRFPLRRQALNKLLHDILQKDIEIIDLYSTNSQENRIFIHASIKIDPITVKVTLPLARKTSLASTPTLYVYIRGFWGFASRMLTPILKRSLPVPYIRLNGDKIEFHIHHFLRTKNLTDVINYLTAIECDSQSDETILSFQLDVM